MKRLFLAVVVLLSFGCLMAQEMPQVPVDENVKIGHLDNGLTYYLRHNAYPEGVASFYIAQRVGSVNEEESQRGLAHLLEHLAFNGTDHFKDNDLQEYLQSIGVEYGRNLNAYTACDETVYYFTDVPTKRATAVDSCMLILKDWSNGISLTKEAIDAERDVVHNEYRMRMVGQQKLLEQALPRLYPGSKYGERMPIGLMSVIDGSDPEAIRSYYRKWYRPDNQAIIIVGDIDVDKTEARIKELFSGITVPADAAQVIPEPVPDHENAVYIVEKDKEMQLDLIMMFLKSDPMPREMKATMMYQLQQYMVNVTMSMINERLQEKSQEPDCPYLMAQCSYGEFLMSSTKDALTVVCGAKPGMAKEAYAAVLTELKRAHDHGFTATEYMRAKDEFMSQMEKYYDNRDKMKNEEFTEQYVAHFTDGDPIPSVETEYMIYQQLTQMLPADAALGMIAELSQEMFSQEDKNFATLCMMKEQDDAVYPTEDELANVVKDVRTSEVEAFVDNVKQEPLLAQIPQAGSIVNTTENAKLGFKELTLSNGAKVLIKKTDYKDNEIQFSAYAKGGSSSFADSKATEMQMLTSIANVSGLGNFSNTELQKAMAGKQASVAMSLDEYTRGLGGSSTPKDLETLMQLIYLNMTAVSKDEKGFGNLQQQFATILANAGSNPEIVYQDSLASTLYCGSKAYRVPTAEDIMALNYEEALSDIHDLYSNARDFTFVLVGNFDEAQLTEYVKTYIASLPNSGKTFANRQIKLVSGKVSNVWEQQMENPQNQVHEYWRSAAEANTLRNRVNVDIAGRLLDMTYNRSIREELSAAYHAGAEGKFEVSADDKLFYIIDGSAQVNPDKSDAAVPCFFSGMKETVAKPNSDDLKKVKEILLKQADVDAKTNGYWVGTLMKYDKYGIDFHTDYKSTISATTEKTISEFLNNVILKSGNQAEVLMKAK